MTLDEAITLWVLEWGKPCLQNDVLWTQEQYEFLIRLGRDLGYEDETEYLAASYTWIQFGYRYKAILRELASNRQRQT